MTDTLTLKLTGDVSLKDFATAVSSFRQLVEALARDLAPKSNIDWIVYDLAPGSAVATVKGIGPPEPVRSIVGAYEKVGVALEQHAPIQEYSRKVRRSAENLLSILNDRIDSIVFETPDRESIIRKRHAEPLQLPSALAGAYGALEGQVETLSRRRGLRFVLYDELFDSAVSCYLSESHEDIMRDAWGKRVVVEGWIRRDPETGRPVSVRRIDKVTVQEAESPVGFRRARGVLATESEVLPEEMLRRVRDDG